MDNVHLLSNTSAVSDCGSFLGTGDAGGVGGALFFYAQPVTFFSDTNYTISSRQIVIGPLVPGNIALDMLPVIAMTTDGPSTVEKEALSTIASDERLAEISELVIIVYIY